MSGGKELDLDVSRVSSASPAEAPKSAEATSAAASVGSGEAAGVDEIARALAAGEIDPAQAQQMLIDQVTAEQLPADASPELVESVRSEVAALLAEDPTLQALLDPHEG